jgi:hypothetical protein
MAETDLDDEVFAEDLDDDEVFAEDDDDEGSTSERRSGRVRFRFTRPVGSFPVGAASQMTQGVSSAVLNTPRGNATLRLPEAVVTKREFDAVTQRVERSLNTLATRIVETRTGLQKSTSELSAQVSRQGVETTKRIRRMRREIQQQSQTSMMMSMMMMMQVTRRIDEVAEEAGVTTTTDQNQNMMFMMLPLMMGGGGGGSFGDPMMMMVMMMAMFPPKQ